MTTNPPNAQTQAPTAGTVSMSAVTRTTSPAGITNQIAGD